MQGSYMWNHVAYASMWISACGNPSRFSHSDVCGSIDTEREPRAGSAAGDS